MAKVYMPFKECFREPMLNGRKIMTSRTKRMGEAGDTFQASISTTQITLNNYINVTPTT